MLGVDLQEQSLFSKEGWDTNFVPYDPPPHCTMPENNLHVVRCNKDQKVGNEARCELII